jgi:FkbM family methyltransferase
MPLKERIKSLAGRGGFQIASTTRSGIYHQVDIGRIRPLSGISVIFDVGGHTGETALFYAGHAPRARIFSFEPVSRNFSALSANTAHVPRIECVNAALGSSTEERLLYHGETSQTHSLVEGVNRHDRGPGSSETIRTCRLDDFAASRGITRIDILKTDTEGYDLEVLRGAEGLLSCGGVDFVYSETGFDSSDSQHTSFFELFEFLTARGFGFLGLYDLAPRPDPWRIEYCNALFSHL